MSSELVLDVDNIKKVYCRHLKRAMWYGLSDLGREIIGKGQQRYAGQLRPGEFFAIRDASFQVKQGECVAMIGPNGAGKSSMLKMINGLIKPNAGSITIRGRIGALIELGTGFNPILSGRENVYNNAAVLGLKKKEVDLLFDEIVEFAELGHVIDDPIKTYSSGMRVRLGFSVAANLRPELLLIDEVLAVGDVGFRMKCFSHLQELIKSGVSVILVTHAIGMLPRVATRSIVFGQGRIIHDGDLETGCAAYEELLGASEREKQARIEDAEPAAAKVSSVQVRNASLHAHQEFQTGDHVTVEITLSSEVEIQHARLIVALESPVVGVLTSVSTPYQEIHFDMPIGDKSVVLEFLDIPLLVGSYHFNISLFGPEITDFYHRATGRGRFKIVGPPVDANGFGINGIIKLHHRWIVG